MKEEEIKNPETTGIIRDEKGRFVPGHSGNPEGRPPGTFSPLTWIKKYFEENPEKAKEWILEYLQDSKNRQHLFNQLEGMPKQKTEITGDASLPFIIKIVKDDSRENS